MKRGFGLHALFMALVTPVVNGILGGKPMKTQWRRNVRAAVLGLAAFLLAGGAADAVPVLDQIFDPGPNPNMATGRLDKAQTLTVGITGTLVEVDVDINRYEGATANLLFDIRPTIGGVPVQSDTTTLASLIIPASSVPTTRGFVSVDLSSFAVSVAAGQVLAIVLRSDPDVASYTWYGNWSDNLYPSGRHYFRHPPGWPRPTWYPDLSTVDVGFKTFVEPVAEPVPEPGTLLLLGSGLAGLAALARRRGTTAKGGERR